MSSIVSAIAAAAAAIFSLFNVYMTNRFNRKNQIGQWRRESVNKIMVDYLQISGKLQTELDVALAVLPPLVELSEGANMFDIMDRAGLHASHQNRSKADMTVRKLRKQLAETLVELELAASHDCFGAARKLFDVLNIRYSDSDESRRAVIDSLNIANDLREHFVAICRSDLGVGKQAKWRVTV